MNSAIVGVGSTGCGRFDASPLELMRQTVLAAVEDAGFEPWELDALIVCPATIAEPRFMTAHYLASSLLPESLKYCGVTSSGGAGPVSGIILADILIKSGVATTIAVVAGDALASMPSKEMLAKISRVIDHPCYRGDSIPVVPLLYDRIAKWQMETYGISREQLAMVPVLMSRQGVKHPLAMNKKILTLDEVLASNPVGEVTNVLECARPADGSGAVIVTFPAKAKNARHKPVYILGGAEATGSPFPPDEIYEAIFPANRAASEALSRAGVGVSHIGWFGIYDCFPICFLRFVEEVGLARVGEGGDWIEEKYRSYTRGCAADIFPVNTHGGLLSFGAPWEAPAIFSIIEGVEQVRGVAGDRQLKNTRSALVYGNGGIFSAAAVAILSP